MWEEVTTDQNVLLVRTAQILRSGDPRSRIEPLSQSVGADRSAISRGTAQIYYYQGGPYELVTKATYQPKSNRYLVCYGVEGVVSPQTGLDLIIDKTRDFAQERDLQFVYGCRPKRLASALLRQIYDLVPSSSRVQQVLLSDLSDMWIYRLAYRGVS